MLIQKLTQRQRWIANITLGAYSFYYLVGDALLKGYSLSTVRMGDGERTLLEDCTNAFATGTEDQLIESYDEAWRIRMGVNNITYKEVFNRMQRAGNECTHFGPSISGLTQKSYELYDYFHTRDQYLDNFFVNIWSDDYKADLFETAGSVLFIHRNRGTADSMQKHTKRLFGEFPFKYIELNRWEQTEDVIDEARACPHRLVIFSGGPASKYLSPAIAKNSGKVVLDIGNSIDRWTFAYHKT
jgi:hypothetical protein